MRNKDYHLYLTDAEYSRIVSALINLKNDLIAQGRYHNIFEYYKFFRKKLLTYLKKVV